MTARKSLPITEFVDTMERAGRNGTRAHLPPAVVRHILAHPAWREFLVERQREMVSQWEEQQPPPPAAPSLVPTGSGIAPSWISGSSPGTTTQELAAEVGLAASRQAFAAVDQIRRRGKPSAPVPRPPNQTTAPILQRGESLRIDICELTTGQPTVLSKNN